MSDLSRTENLERRQRILDAALELVLHYGYDKTTVSDIAREAGVSKGAIYLHYASKEDLMEALIWRESWVYADHMMRNMEAEKDDWSFVLLYKHAMGAILHSPLMQALIRGDEAILGSFMRKRGNKIVAMKTPVTIEMLTKMQEFGGLRQDLDIKAVAYILLAMNHGMVSGFALVPEEDHPSMGAVLNMLGDMLQRTLVPEDGGNKEALKAIFDQIMASFRAMTMNDPNAGWKTD